LADVGAADFARTFVAVVVVAATCLAFLAADFTDDVAAVFFAAEFAAGALVAVFFAVAMVALDPPQLVEAPDSTGG